MLRLLKDEEDTLLEVEQDFYYAEGEVPPSKEELTFSTENKSV